MWPWERFIATVLKSISKHNKIEFLKLLIKIIFYQNNLKDF